MPDPAELPGPDDPGTGTKFPGRVRWEIPREIPYELPIDFNRNILQEILAVRGRLHALENAAIIERFSGRFGGIIGGPNELPNPDDPGGGGGGGVFPGEIPSEIPYEMPAELPYQGIERLVDERINVLRTEMNKQLEEIKALVSKRG
jgi:hypothetical protein